MLYLLLAIASSAAMAVVLKCFRNQKGNRYGILLGNYLTCVAISVFMLPDKGMILSGSWITLICGIGGVFFVLALVCMQSSIRRNGAGITSAFARLGLIVALGLSILLFREVPTAMQLIGIGLAIGAMVVLRTDGSPEKREKGRGFWLLVVTLIASGCADAMAKVFDVYGSAREDSLYFFWLFGTAVVLCGILLLIEQRQTGEKVALGAFAAGILVGIPNYFSSYLLLRSLQTLPAVLVYPTYSTATILLVLGLSAFFFRERLTRRQWPGIALILLALVLLNL